MTQCVEPARAIAFWRLLALLMLATLSLVFARDAHAETAVSGSIATDAHWTLSGSPYVVSGNVLVQSNATLIIDAGVSVYMEAGASFDVQAGSVRAIGTAAQPIKVLSIKSLRGGTPAPGDYGTWRFGPGTAPTARLEYLRIEHGRGLVVNGSAPVFNYLDIRNNQGPAISIDLSASPSGVGNQASGNDINGIDVPAGDIVGSVKWNLSGIAYVVRAGTLSVGRSPTVTQVTPATIEQGQTLSVAVDGVRLDGFGAGSADRSGLTLTPIGGGTSSRLSFQLKANADAALGPAALSLRVDAGELVLPNALTVTPPMPAVTQIEPATVIAGSGVADILVTGRNFSARSEVLVNSAALPTQFVSATQLRASLPNQTIAGVLPLQVRNPHPDAGAPALLSNSTNLAVQMPVPPTVAFEPTPIAMPPDNKAHDITLRLSKPDIRDHTLNFSVSDAAKATVTPTSLTIAAGQVTARVTITPIAQGSVTLLAQSATLGNSSTPIFITPDFRGVNTSYALPVGVKVGEGVQADPIEFRPNSIVGIGVGAVLADVLPAGWAAGTTQTFQVRGNAIPPGSLVSIVPADGVTLGATTVSPDGAVLSVPVTTAGDAAIGPRRVVVRDNNGSLLTFADPSRAVVMLAAGLPRIDSITPIDVARNSTVTMVLRGRNLQNAKLAVTPGSGLEVDAQPTVNADGTELTANVSVAADATLGPRIVQASNATGISAGEASAANTLHVVGAIASTYGWTAPLVGVTVGQPVVEPQQIVPVLMQHVGVVVGASATNVTPRIGIVGSTVTVNVRGQGLQGVTTVSLVPSTGLTVGSPTASADGSELSFTIQVAADAALGLRRLVLGTTSGPLAFANIMDGTFLVSTPLPVVESVSPQVLAIGASAQGMTVRGRYLDNVTDVRFVPADGITVIRPFTVSEGGKTLGFAVQVAAGSAAGARRMIVTTAAGDSATDASPANTVALANQVGPSYPAILSAAIGVRVGDNLGQSYDGALVAPTVGVLVIEETVPPQPIDLTPIARTVGLVVGGAARGKSVDGWLQGASDTLRIHGVGLAQVTAVEAVPSAGILFGPVSVDAAGTGLEASISIAQDAALGTRRLRLRTSDGELAWVSGDASLFGIGRVPTMDSVSPIVLTAGETTTLTVRGRDLAGVTGATFAPDSGLAQIGAPVWSQDATGEQLKITVHIDADATPGTRVLQLRVPGGITSSTPGVANTITVVAGP